MNNLKGINDQTILEVQTKNFDYMYKSDVLHVRVPPIVKKMVKELQVNLEDGFYGEKSQGEIVTIAVKDLYLKRVNRS